MAVNIRRRANIAVTQPLLNLLQRHIVCQKQRGAAVSNSWNSISDFYCTIS